MSTITEQAAALRAQDPLATLSSREREVFDLAGVGELCVGGMRYAVHLDADGGLIER
jgi:hypothetical protein